MKSLLAGGLIVVLCFASPARAWNNVGHMTIAEIAWQLLSPDERAKAATILQSTPMGDDLLKSGMEDGVDVGEWTFIRAASWPDEVRPSRPGDKMFKDATITQYHHAPWHYVDLPYQIDNTPVPPDKTKPDAKDAGSTLLTAYPLQLAALSAAGTSPKDRAVALCWVEHLVGDIHQPLHATSMYSMNFPDGDKGGNSQEVRTPYGVKNLHSLWDEMLGTGPDFQTPPSYTLLHLLGTRLLADPRCDMSHDPDYLQHKQIAEWAAESKHYAITIVYQNGKLRTSIAKPYGQKGDASDSDVPELPTEYLENARALAELRVAEAGHRLADVLHSALATVTPAPAAPSTMPATMSATK